MKRVLIILISAITFSACRDDYPASKVPSVVHNTVNTRFPGAIDIDWAKNTNDYEAEFDLKGIEYTVFVDPTGKLVSYKYDIKFTEFPEPILSVISTQYKDYKIDEAEKVEKNDSTYYQAELEGKKKKELRLVFFADGKMADQINYLK